MAGCVVFVPIYGRLDLAERCLRSLDATTPGAVPFLVIDDCGPERTSDSWLAGVMASGRATTLLVNDRNLGFVQTANRAFAARQGRDVLLVNSDVVVFPGWYDGMLAAAGQGVASVTAMSNQGSIATIAQGCLYSSPEQLAPIAEAAPDRGAVETRHLAELGAQVLLDLPRRSPGDAQLEHADDDRRPRLVRHELSREVVAAVSDRRQALHPVTLPAQPLARDDGAFADARTFVFGGSGHHRRDHAPRRRRRIELLGERKEARSLREDLVDAVEVVERIARPSVLLRDEHEIARGDVAHQQRLL